MQQIFLNIELVYKAVWALAFMQVKKMIHMELWGSCPLEVQCLNYSQAPTSQTST